MGPLIMAMIGMAFWGIAPIFGKLSLARVDPILGLCIRTFIAASLVTGWMIGSRQLPALQTVSTSTWVLLTLEALCATLLGDLAYFAALKWGHAGEVSVIMSAAPIVTLVLARLFLRETTHSIQLLGASLVMVGLWLLSTPRDG